MKHKTLLLTAFVIVAMAQLFVPVQMISHQTKYAQTGNEFKFKVRHNRGPIAPGRISGKTIQGRFVYLQFEANKYKSTNKNLPDFSKPFFVSLTTDSLGFAKVKDLSQKKPVSEVDWIKARAFKARGKDSTLFQISFPFANYFIEDANTNDIDSAFSLKLKDSLSVVFLKVRIRENQFHVKDLVVDSLSFKDFVRKVRKEHAN